MIDGVERTFVLDRPETTIGRGDDNDIVLTDLVTSMHHAVVLHHQDTWWIRDQESRYGVRVNGDVADETELEPGDVITIGTVDLIVEPLAGTPTAVGDDHEDDDDDDDDEILLNADIIEAETLDAPTLDAPTHDAPTLDPPAPELDNHDAEALDLDDDAPVLGVVRPIEDFAVSLGFDLDPTDAPTPPASMSEVADDLPAEGDHGYSSLAVGYLSRLGHELRTAADVDEAARRTLDTAFAAFPIDRGWVLFTDESGEIVEGLSRIGDTTAHPEGRLPISMTIVRRVLADRVSVGTGDITFDAQRASQSMMAHHIRAAMCAPLWSGDRVSGVIYVDSLLSGGPFTQTGLDLLTAMANYAAVAVEGLRHAQTAEREREARRHLERYHSPAMIEAIAHREAYEGMSKLRQADVTVLFADVVGFASVSETLSPDGVARLLDGFFTEAVEAVFAHGGTLDKFIGDAVMAFFGAPVAAHDHAEQALRAALDLRYRIARWNEGQADAGGRPIEVRMALNSGPVVVGDVGSSRRVDYTVLGNTVNIAARLEGVGAPGEIVIGPGTRQRLPADFPLEPLGELDLKGIRHPVPVWKVATRPA